ncbi:unnamed protein product [Penicillium roqueforti FM164]|uniref:Genomic scaffold, ProqFM164S02 n=1 Tax=Penicillium roqueforti (strain FM164) TaxID=1365484 RepID=W6Q6T7_PENRF|nr:unnamed protein product [Penicillium roqueforti FM164]
MNYAFKFINGVNHYLDNPDIQFIYFDSENAEKVKHLSGCLSPHFRLYHSVKKITSGFPAECEGVINLP